MGAYVSRVYCRPIQQYFGSAAHGTTDWMFTCNWLLFVVRFLNENYLLSARTYWKKLMRWSSVIFSCGGNRKLTAGSANYVGTFLSWIVQKWLWVYLFNLYICCFWHYNLLNLNFEHVSVNDYRFGKYLSHMPVQHCSVQLFYFPAVNFVERKACGKKKWRLLRNVLSSGKILHVDLKWNLSIESVMKLKSMTSLIHFWITNWSHVATHLVVVVVVLVVATSSTKPKAPSFQIRLWWNLTSLFFT